MDATISCKTSQLLFNRAEQEENGVDEYLNYIPTVPSSFLLRRSRTPSPVRDRRRKEG